MTLPMILTVGRIPLAPLFFLLFQLARGGRPVLIACVWVVFLVIEISDLLDGYLARRLKQESELGKVLDPLADTLCRLTYFIALAGVGIFPPWMLLVLIYRDFAVAYVRVAVSRAGVMLAARITGKLKAWIYAIAAGAGMLVFSLRLLGWLPDWLSTFQWLAFGLFLATVAIAAWSFADYGVFFLKNFRKSS